MKRATIHMNGDTLFTLKEQLLAVHSASRALQEALNNTSPNMRNYYVNENPNEDFDKDRSDLIKMLNDVRTIEMWAVESAARLMNQAGE